MEDNILGLLGLMRRAAAIQAGEDNASGAIHAGRARLLLLASDINENAQRRAEGYVFGHRTLKVPMPYTGAELASALGMQGCSMAAVTDIGFANALMKSLCQRNADAYTELANEMEQRFCKAERRKKQTAQNKANKRNAKRRMVE